MDKILCLIDQSNVFDEMANCKWRAIRNGQKTKRYKRQNGTKTKWYKDKMAQDEMANGQDMEFDKYAN